MKYLVLLGLLSSCANIKPTKSKSLFCSHKDKSIQSRHLIMMANSQQEKLIRCFRNFLRFEENKKQRIVVCNTLNVRKSGRVSYARVFGPNVPKDLAMCLEQELWTMNFKALQLDKSVYVQYPLTLNSI